MWDNRVRLRWDTAIGGSATAPSGGGEKSVGILSNAGGGGAGPTIDKTAARILMQVCRTYKDGVVLSKAGQTKGGCTGPSILCTPPSVSNSK